MTTQTPYEIGYQLGRYNVKAEPRPWFCGAQIGSEDEVTSYKAGVAYSQFCDGTSDGTREAWLAERRDGEGLLAWYRRTRSARN